MLHTKLLRFGQFHVLPFHGVNKFKRHPDIFRIFLSDDIIGWNNTAEMGVAEGGAAQNNRQTTTCSKQVFATHR